MGKKLYDEFSKEPLDKMAQSIADMTFGYNSTVVPKKHYKDCLDNEIMELLSNDVNMEVSFLKPYYDIIDNMIKENKKYFIKALLMHQMKLKYSSLTNQNIQAIATVWDFFEDNKLKHFLNEELIITYEEFLKPVKMNMSDKN